MLYKSCYFIKAVCLSFLLITSFVVLGQVSNDDSLKMKVGIIDKIKLPASNQHGFSVEEIEAIFPEAVKRKTETYMFGKNTYRTRIVKTVDMESLILILAASVKEHQAQIAQLKQQVQALTNKPVAVAK